MNKTILLLFLTTQVFSQKVSLFLKNDNFDIENRSFYINEIRDERKIKELGVLTINNLKVNAVCIPDVRFEIRSYLKKLLTKTTTQVPVNLVIREFSFREMSNSSTEVALVLDFFLLDTSQNKEILAKSINQKKNIEVVGKIDNIERIFKEIIQSAIAELQGVQWSFYQKQTSPLSYKKTDPYTDVPLILFEMGSFNRGLIAKVTHSRNLRINDESGIGRSFTYGFQFPIEFENKEDWTEISTLVGGDFYKRVKNNWYGNLALHMPLGIVKTEQKTSFFIGLTSHQRLMMIKHYGAKFSLGLYQTLSTHPIYPFGLGFTLGIGWAKSDNDD